MTLRDVLRITALNPSLLLGVAKQEGGVFIMLQIPKISPLRGVQNLRKTSFSGVSEQILVAKQGGVFIGIPLMYASSSKLKSVFDTVDF